MFSYLKTVTKICVTEGQKTCLHNFGGKHLWYDAVLDWGLNPGPPALNHFTEIKRTKTNMLVSIYRVGNLVRLGLLIGALLTSLVKRVYRPSLLLVVLKVYPPKCTFYLYFLAF